MLVIFAHLFEQAHYLRLNARIADWYIINEQSTHSRFPVLDDKNRVVGMVTSKDIIGKELDFLIDKVMTKIL